jgi:hypothetical protein
VGEGLRVGQDEGITFDPFGGPSIRSVALCPFTVQWPFRSVQDP